MKETVMGQSKRIPSFYEPSAIGKSLKEVSVDYIKAENQKIRSQWYHSNLDADLFLFKDQKDRLIKQQLGLYGLIVEWNILDGVKTGVVIEEVEHAADMGASEIIRFDREPNETAIQQALQVIDNIEDLGVKVRELLKANLISPWAMSNEWGYSETEKLLKYVDVEYLKNKERQDPPSVFTRFFQWLFRSKKSD